MQNAFELCSYATTIVFSRPDQFRYPVLISAVAVTIAGALYAHFVRSRRGHLLHFPACVDVLRKVDAGQAAWRRTPSQREMYLPVAGADSGDSLGLASGG